jgi:hypothetical protein
LMNERRFIVGWPDWVTDNASQFNCQSEVRSRGK